MIVAEGALQAQDNWRKRASMTAYMYGYLLHAKLPSYWLALPRLELQ